VSDLLPRLRAIVGARHVLTGAQATARYRHGYRTGSGKALAVVRPGSLVEQWRVARACVAADVSIIMQASNTGLTGGSTPDGDDYPGGCVIISTTRIDGLHLIRDGTQVICLPGTTLYALEKALAPLGREPHSVIGSSCFGASVVGGVCNNSGGSLVQRGPAYTQLSLYAQVDADGALRLVNHLGVALGDDPEEMLRRLEAGDFRSDDVDASADSWAHDHDYAGHVRDIDNATPARFNADSRCLYEAAGSAGKMIVFAVRLDSFVKEEGASTFYIGTNDPAQLTAIRRIILGEFSHLPVAGEYMHCDAFDIADRYGKDMFFAIERLGTDRLPRLFWLKAQVDALPFVGAGFSDRMMQRIGRLLPDHLPREMRSYRARFEHHLLLKMPKAAVEQTRALLARLFAAGEGDYFECSAALAAKAFLHRFVAAGAAVRYRAVHSKTVEDIIPLDVALPRNALEWQEKLPPDLAAQCIHSLYYGHFLCHVFHQDYIVRKGVEPLAFEHRIWALLDDRGAEYPAEHNVGHLYRAKPALADFYRRIDPRNQCNPGIGQTARARHWGEQQEELGS